jgi:hypothetical protein
MPARQVGGNVQVRGELEHVLVLWGRCCHCPANPMYERVGKHFFTFISFTFGSMSTPSRSVSEENYAQL